MGLTTLSHRLREIRERLGLTLKDVERRSRQLVARHNNPEYLFTAGRLSQVENSNSLPSLYKLATLSEIYHLPYNELLRLYGIETGDELSPRNPAPADAESGRSERFAEVRAHPRWE